MWQSIELEKGNKVPKLESFRVTFLTHIIEEINNYFPENGLDHFDVLEPKKIPENEAQLLLYGHDYIHGLAVMFRKDAGVCVREWTQALLQITKQDDFCRFQKTSPITFWQHYTAESEVANLLGGDIKAHSKKSRDTDR